ncbi:CG12617 [Drosophila busckii]|uniref:CG12617 n=1 Tax=Drosophila busckii TaxID=30019 RepID=A0A0M4E3D5_DROBS|nr:uncharacterized protein LOC108604484 [Drosophila busckii]ALC38108.1 CG12617 [Drosophila busckii]
MSLALKHKLLRKPLDAASGWLQLQQVRHHAPICGPPRFPLSTGQRLIMGVGGLVLMMILPVWMIYQTPRWSALHNNRPYRDDEPPPADE